MTPYENYLPELRTTTLFCGLTDQEILRVLDAMHPPIKAGLPGPLSGKDGRPLPDMPFRMVLRSTPAREQAARYFKYDMPQFGEPGMLMAEIPSLSRMLDYVKPQGGPPGGPHGHRLDFEMETLEFTPEMITRPYGTEVAGAAGQDAPEPARDPRPESL